jgi:hypothetical protein
MHTANARTFSFAIGSRWASPADFLSFHKPFLVCPYRKTHDPVDDASFNCWQFLQCVSILWMNEYAEIHHQPRKEESAAAKSNNASGNGASPYQSKQASTATSPKGSTQKPAYSDAEFPTIASANATNDRRKQQQQQRSPRRARAFSTLATTKDKTASSSPSPSRGSKQQHQHQHHSAHHQPHQQPQPAKATPPAGATAPATNGRRTARSYSDPPLVELEVSSNTASAIAKASSFNTGGHPQHPRTPVQALF